MVILSEMRSSTLRDPGIRRATDVDIWTELARAETAGGDTIVLRQRGDIFDIRFNGWELMSSRNVASETALAEMVCRRIDRTAPRILIGGLGMGYTLRAVLDAVGPGAQVVVCELLAEVVAWNKGVLSPLAGHPLRDDRVTVLAKDVADVIAESDQRFDAILLDTDNGPDCIVHEANAVLYTTVGLSRLSRIIERDTVIGFWSATESRRFEDALESAGWEWQRFRLFLRAPDEEPFHVVYLAGRALREPA
jgi:predicted membrane-bound spermidine synthase